MQQKIYDIIIAGAGPAGLTAAVYARRAGKSVLLIEKEAFGGQITLSPHVENYPFTRPMSGNELVEVLVEQVMNLGADVEVGAVVDVSENADKTVTVRTDYQEFTGRTLIIATGLKHRLPGAEGEQKFIGSGISFCAVCDGAFFKHSRSGCDISFKDLQQGLSDSPPQRISCRKTCCGRTCCLRKH